MPPRRSVTNGNRLGERPCSFRHVLVMGEPPPGSEPHRPPPSRTNIGLGEVDVADYASG